MATRRAIAADAAARRKAAAGATAAAAADAAVETTVRSTVGDPPGATSRGAGTGGPKPPLGGRAALPPPEARVSARVIDADEPPEPTTFVGVLRFLALGAHIVLAATFVWFVVESRRATTSSGDGGLDPTRIDRLDLVRTATVVAFAVMVLLIGAWGAAMSMLAQRSDRSAPPPWLIMTACVPATLFALAGLVVHERVGDGFVFTLAVLAAGLGGACSLALLSKMSSDVEDGSHGMQIWAAAIAVVGLGLTIGGYMQSIDPGDSLDTLTLVAVLSSILVGLGMLLGAPASGDLEDLVSEEPPAYADRNG